VIADSILKLYDEPVRNWLQRRWLGQKGTGKKPEVIMAEAGKTA